MPGTGGQAKKYEKVLGVKNSPPIRWVKQFYPPKPPSLCFESQVDLFLNLRYTMGNMEEKVRQSILQTLAYFDVFDYPLTSLELERFLCLRITDTHRAFLFGNNPDLRIDQGVVFEQLQHLIQLKQLQHKEGYYFLPGREKIVVKRQRNIWFVERKMKRALRGIKKLARVPFVRAVFVCNTVAGVGVEESSDIDVFIVVKKGRIFLARAVATFYLSLFNMRRTKRKIKNKICLSFYVADNNLNLSGIAFEKDIYLMYWLTQLIPVYDPDNLFKSLQKANTWVKKYLPNAFQSYDLIPRWKVMPGKVANGIKKLLEKMWTGNYGDLMEKQAKIMQLNKMKMNVSSVQNESDTRVVVNDDMLKFHEKDKREEYREVWIKKCMELKIGK